MRACSLLPSIPEGRAIHSRILKAGLGADRFIASSVISFYSSCGQLGPARQVFDGVFVKDAALQTTMLKGYVEHGDIAKARALFDEMNTRDVIAWNAMISGYAQSGLPEDALELFHEMQISNFQPNEVTLIGALSACSQMGCLALGEWIHGYIDRHLDVIRSPTLGNALVHMYAKCGRLDAAFELFLGQKLRNLESWNAMLTGFAIHGHGTCALSLFSQMIKLGAWPDRISFLAVLMACSHAGMIDHARRCLNCMTRIYGIEPEAKHYGCMVDILSRGGHLEEARSLLSSMPFEPDACAWGALLHGCLTYGNYDLGLEASGHLIELEPWEEGRYVALLNLYSMTGRVKDAIRVRKVIDEVGIKQSSGRSMIEVDGVAHEFLAGDRSHSQSSDIFSMIEKIASNLELLDQLD
ncbi:pentatricopeptide repeat-containing protein At5g56310-like [Phoenix dactylifera]|uniref:Pentatricopeptide repeat-containing protein At5g56310-like n=1 Tax=Phoenix dactylifera TaxID=42345 RepID=A0A8B7CTF5_PHODC|nr:pentatricopeptide repeat-containing protein At5g56310-like [Phoenix dactylifera]